jgi:hypothetical protein
MRSACVWVGCSWPPQWSLQRVKLAWPGMIFELDILMFFDVLIFRSWLSPAALIWCKCMCSACLWVGCSWSPKWSCQHCAGVACNACNAVTLAWPGMNFELDVLILPIFLIFEIECHRQWSGTHLMRMHAFYLALVRIRMITEIVTPARRNIWIRVDDSIIGFICKNHSGAEYDMVFSVHNKTRLHR